MEKRGLVFGLIVGLIFSLFLILGVNSQDKTFSYEGYFEEIGTVYILSDKQLMEGYTQDLEEKDFFKINIGSLEKKICYIWVDTLKLEKKEIMFIISRNPRKITLSLGNEEKVDIDYDNTYDLLLKFDNLKDGKAEIFLKEISEEVPPKEALFDGFKRNIIFYIIIVCVVVLVIILIIFFIRYLRKPKKPKPPKNNEINKTNETKETNKPNEIKETKEALERKKSIIIKAKEFVESARKKGIKDKQVKDLFRKKGWKEEDINKIF